MSQTKRLLKLLITVAKYFIGMAEKEIREIEQEEKMVDYPSGKGPVC